MEKTALRKLLIRDSVMPDPMVEAIREVCRRMELVENRFSMESDPDLIEGCIFELEALKAQYRYLLRSARERGVVCRERNALWNE